MRNDSAPTAAEIALNAPQFHRVE